MKQLFLFSLVILTGASISACSVKAGAPDVPAPPEKAKVNGPDLSGSWASGCQRSSFGEYKTFDVVFAGNTVSRKSSTYSDNSCTTATDSKTEAGTFSFIQANKDGSFTVQYKIPMRNGVSWLPSEKILLDNGVLYLSDYALGDSITKDMMVGLHKVPQVSAK